MKEDVAFPGLRTPLQLSKSCMNLNTSVKLQITFSVLEVVLFRLILTNKRKPGKRQWACVCAGYKCKASPPSVVTQLAAASTKITAFLGNTETKLAKSLNLKI